MSGLHKKHSEWIKMNPGILTLWPRINTSFSLQTNWKWYNLGVNWQWAIWIIFVTVISLCLFAAWNLTFAYKYIYTVQQQWIQLLQSNTNQMVLSPCRFSPQNRWVAIGNSQKAWLLLTLTNTELRHLVGTPRPNSAPLFVCLGVPWSPGTSGVKTLNSSN